MTSTDQQLVDELNDRLETLLFPDAVRLIELRHADEGEGIDRDLLDAYLDEIEYGMDAFPSSFEEALTESESWQGGRRVYTLGSGRVSAFPAGWHEQLRDTTDLREYLRVMCAEGDETEDDSRDAVSEDGVAEELLLDAVVAIGGTNRDDVREQLRKMREEGKVEEYPSQHPNPWVQLS